MAKKHKKALERLIAAVDWESTAIVGLSGEPDTIHRASILIKCSDKAKKVIARKTYTVRK